MAGVTLGAWGLSVAAVRVEERERSPWQGVDAGVPSSPSWGCKAGCPAGRETCGAAGVCGDDGSAGTRRGCARWGRPNRGRASGCCGWSIPIRFRCPSASQLRRLRRLRQRGTSPLHPRCCRGLYCCGVAHPRSLSSHCFGSLWTRSRESVLTRDTKKSEQLNELKSPQHMLLSQTRSEGLKQTGLIAQFYVSSLHCLAATLPANHPLSFTAICVMGCCHLGRITN